MKVGWNWRIDVDIYGISSVRHPAVQGVEQRCDAAANAQFQSYLEDLQLRSDLLAHLKGVPLDTVTIPLHILEEMKTIPSTYTYYMNAIDEYVRAYRQYNCPGILRMSFFITEDGAYCIRGENLILSCGPKLRHQKQRSPFRSAKAAWRGHFFPSPSRPVQVTLRRCPPIWPRSAAF